MKTRIIALACLMGAMGIMTATGQSKFRNLAFGTKMDLAYQLIKKYEKFSFDYLQNSVLVTKDKPVEIGQSRLNIKYVFSQTKDGIVLTSGAYFLESLDEKELNQAFQDLLGWATSGYGKPDIITPVIDFPCDPNDNGTWSRAVIINYWNNATCSWTNKAHFEISLLQNGDGKGEVDLTFHN
jgi:hypothetical protein